ncbi:hypothetical protein MLP_11560 [Microlunatus phosphovorus NM-1]|uniref:Uncharacterized protein n=1 Tax=Microlunatus phosphovorus (strain ATCC 700054 / DSM 10555 / JCM 9379 / NBRC 101784 / NCIMB 13414 / VKM Ac-1990 / NM-1) TaxID=1032480 RepID=F5XNQ6_MICPN|nr:GAP family protein [Microlunatus phosphovorus]BAK34170.1 hypothetical protein MLP_11560 [Microlunatus phosphovorus NM-1]
MTLSAFVAHSLPLVLLAAVSPVLFLNASRVVESAGAKAGAFFAAGAACCLLALGVPAMGLMGAATSQKITAELTSRGVDLVLAAVLIGYGVQQLVKSRRPHSPSKTSGASQDAALPKDGRGLFAAGLLGMITNFTTLPLFLSVAQRLGAVSIDWALRSLLLIVVIAIVVTPTWLPMLLHAIAPAKSGLSPQLRARIQRATQQISIGACFLGGAVIIWHVFTAR